MGQQLSGEAYCRATMQKLLAELNTTDSRVSESHVTPCDGGEAAAAALSVDFTWREWARVSKYLERVLPCTEQKRLLNHALLDRTGLRGCRNTDVPDGQAVGSGWSVHVNYGDDGSRNPILYRDFVKLHFQLDGVPADPATDGVGDAAADNGEGEGGVADRLAELVKRRCSGVGVNLLVTKAKWHAGQSCVVVSGTVDIRSVLRNSGQLELRSRLNPAKAEDQELPDQLLRSAAGLRDRIDGAASAAAAAATGGPAGGQRYFPMRLSYSEVTNRVTLVYAQETRAADETAAAAGAD